MNMRSSIIAIGAFVCAGLLMASVATAQTAPDAGGVVWTKTKSQGPSSIDYSNFIPGLVVPSTLLEVPLVDGTMIKAHWVAPIPPSGYRYARQWAQLRGYCHGLTFDHGPFNPREQDVDKILKAAWQEVKCDGPILKGYIIIIRSTNPPEGDDGHVKGFPAKGVVLHSMKCSGFNKAGDPLFDSKNAYLKAVYGVTYEVAMKDMLSAKKLYEEEWYRPLTPAEIKKRKAQTTTPGDGEGDEDTDPPKDEGEDGKKETEKEKPSEARSSAHTGYGLYVTKGLYDDTSYVVSSDGSHLMLIGRHPVIDEGTLGAPEVYASGSKAALVYHLNEKAQHALQEFDPVRGGLPGSLLFAAEGVGYEVSYLSGSLIVADVPLAVARTLSSAAAPVRSHEMRQP